MPLLRALICLVLLELRICSEDSPNTITFNLFASLKCVQEILLKIPTLAGKKNIKEV